MSAFDHLDFCIHKINDLELAHHATVYEFIHNLVS